MTAPRAKEYNIGSGLISNRWWIRKRKDYIMHYKNTEMNMSSHSFKVFAFIEFETNFIGHQDA